MGYLWTAGYIEDGKFFYCPSQQHEAFIYESYANPVWPSDYIEAVRVSYHFNPEIAQDPSNRSRWYRVHSRIDRMRPRTILVVDLLRADGIAHLSSQGFNVAYGDGSVSFVQDPTIVEDVVNKRGDASFSSVWFDNQLWYELMERFRRQ